MLIGEMEKNQSEVIRIKIEEFKGYKFLDIRVYFQDQSGEWKPTKKGVAVPFEKIENFIGLVNKIQEKLKG
jgi:hypothetical protein